ncbi:MAG: PEP-CTERM sorting domain-containing protein, partial [Bryobacteraceae bacterium]
ISSTVANNGTILANGGAVALTGGTVTGGNVIAADGGTLTASSSTILNDVNLIVNDSLSSASIGGTITGSTIGVGGTLTLNGATISDTVLANYGIVNVSGGLNTMSGTLVNEAAGTMNIGSGSALEFEAGAADSFANPGTINVAATGALIIDSAGDFAQYQVQTLTGGTYNIAGMFQFAGADIVTNQADLALAGSGVVEDGSLANGLRDFSDNGDQGQFSLLNGATFTSGGDFANSGAVTIDAGSDFNAGANTYTQTGGSTIVDGTLLAATIDLNGGDISGTGTLEGNLDNQGDVDPGDAPGTLIIDGDYTQSSSGVLNIEIDGASDFDRLAISGDAELDGTLNVTFGGGFGPQNLETFTIMTFRSVSGDFTSMNPAGNWLEIRTTDSLSLEYILPEPSTWVLLAFGLMGLGWFRRCDSLRHD